MVLYKSFPAFRETLFSLNSTELILKRRLSGALLGKLFLRGLQDLANES